MLSLPCPIIAPSDDQRQAPFTERLPLFAHLGEIAQPRRRQLLTEFEPQARLSKALVTLKDDVPLPCPLSDLIVRPPDPQRLSRFLQEMEFRALALRVMGRLSAVSPTPRERR